MRFGIVGCGVIGATHAAAIAGLPDATLVAVADRERVRADRLAVRYGATPYADLAVMLSRADLDVVTVCTPSGQHGAHARAIMRTGRHVIVEKPIEITRASIDDMLRVQDETGVKLAVISQHRFDGAAQQVQRLVAAGAFGRLVLGSACVPWWRSQAYYDSGAWRGTWELDGGGVLMNQAIHSIDLLHWLMGPVRSLHAYVDTLSHRMETEDVAVAVLRFASGALGTIAATTAAYPGVTTRVEVYGDRGSAAIENDRLGYLHLERDDAEPVDAYGANSANSAVGREPRPAAGSVASATVSAPARDPAAVPGQAHALQIADMIRAIREDGTPLVDGHVARHAVDIILGVYDSARTGREVVLA